MVACNWIKTKGSARLFKFFPSVLNSATCLFMWFKVMWFKVSMFSETLQMFGNLAHNRSCLLEVFAVAAETV